MSIVESGAMACFDAFPFLSRRNIPYFRLTFFCPHNPEHLAEEERDISPLLRAHFTQKENDEIVLDILKRGGVQSMRNLLPSVLVAMQQWGSLDFYEEFWGSIPGPVRHLATNYFIPDYENCIAAKRDAPFWEATAKNRHQQRPPLKRTKCCKISFCFPCII